MNAGLDEPDLRGPAIIVEGGVIGGFTFHGPFPTIEDASQWWNTTLPAQLGQQCSIAILEAPDAARFGKMIEEEQPA